jgi:hypothetical protein
MFQLKPGLSGQECEEFQKWVLSQNADVSYVILAEYDKMRDAGLTIDTAEYMYEEVYETHLVPLDEAGVYFLFFRSILEKVIVNLGQCSMERGKAYAVDLARQRASKFLGRTLRWGNPRSS